MKTQILCIIFSTQLICGCNNQEAERMAEKLNATAENLKELNKQRVSDSLRQATELQAMKDSIRAAQALAGDDFSILYDQLKQSVFMITVTGQNEISQGTCFAIDNNGTCLSNYHVFGSDPKSAKIMTYDRKEFYVTEILEQNEEMDYIKFRVNTRGETFYPLPIASTTPKVGEQAFTIGNPEGLSHTFSKGVISAIRGNGAYIQTTTDITHGSSGGPLFNTKGEVIGITTGTMGTEANLNIAVNISMVNSNTNNKDLSGAFSEATDESDATGADYGYFRVKSSKAYFRNQPNSFVQARSAYLVFGESGRILDKSGAYIYVDFINSKGQRSKGWIQLFDVEIK